MLYENYYANLYLPYIFLTNTNMEKHLAPSREYLAQRGHMVSFLMVALMVTAWLNVFQDTVNAAAISTYF